MEQLLEELEQRCIVPPEPVPEVREALQQRAAKHQSEASQSGTGQAFSDCSEDSEQDAVTIECSSDAESEDVFRASPDASGGVSVESRTLPGNMTAPTLAGRSAPKRRRV